MLTLPRAPPRWVLLVVRPPLPGRRAVLEAVYALPVGPLGGAVLGQLPALQLEARDAVPQVVDAREGLGRGGDGGGGRHLEQELVLVRVLRGAAGAEGWAWAARERQRRACAAPTVRRGRQPLPRRAVRPPSKPPEVDLALK
jgi:hypothetical protein